MRYLKSISRLSVVVVVVLTAFALLGCQSLLPGAWGSAAGLTDRQGLQVSTASIATGSTVPDGVATTRDGVQYVSSTVSSGAYGPITVSQGLPVVWSLEVPKGALNGCNNRIIIPEYNLEVALHEGTTVVEFTPDTSGIFQFTCWMGMIASSITVLGADGSLPASPGDGRGGAGEGTGAGTPGQQFTGCGCCSRQG